jgi:hypothetical protein
VSFEQPHVREPNLGRQELGFAGSCQLQSVVDSIQDLPGLRADIANWVRRYTAYIDSVPMLDDTTDDRATLREGKFMACDVHSSVLEYA